MKIIYKKYHGKPIEDWSCYLSEDAKTFCKDFKKRLSVVCKNNNWTLKSFSIGHYDFYGFIEKDQKFIYFHYDIERGGRPLNLEDKSCMSGILVRTAKNEKDFTGGSNNFASILTFENTIQKIFEKGY